ncbi:hypothetical protein JVU11DRAFT_3880 [Chiua virens]|nr:hypothetical protein JVU11DRAFT_3880 [Chiua virens]
MLVGFVLDTILYGVVVTQSLVYFSCYKSDGLWFKLFVASLLALDTLNVVLEFVYMYDALITHFGDPNVLFIANWVFSTVPGTTGITSALVQLFFAWRVKVLKQSRLLVATIVALALAGMLCGIGTAVAVNLVPTFTEFHRFRSIVIIWLFASAADNLLITISLVLSLRHFCTGFADTDHVIKKIIRLTLHTGLLTAVWTIVDLSVYLAMTNGLHLVFVLPLAKFYTNSLLSTLISRSRDPSDLEFNAVDGSPYVERRENFLTLHSREEVHLHCSTFSSYFADGTPVKTLTRNTEIIFETVLEKKLPDQTTSDNC